MRWPAKVAASALLIAIGTALVGIASSNGANVDTGSPTAPTIPATTDARIPLPAKCARYSRERTEEEWDPVREEYWPPNHEWETCMGVERR